MSEKVPPGLMARSFLTVALLYIGILVFCFLGYAGLIRFAFPEINEVMMDTEDLQILFESSPEKVFSTAFVWSLLAWSALISLIAGFCAVRFAPFAQFPHAVFLAILVFVTLLQQSIAAPPTGKWIFLLPAAVLPCSILIGARIGMGKRLRDSSE